MSDDFADKFIADFIAGMKAAPKADFSGLSADIQRAADRIELRRSRERGPKVASKSAAKPKPEPARELVDDEIPF